MMDYLRSFLSFSFAICVMYTLLDCEIQNKKKLSLLVFYIIAALIFDGFILLHFGYIQFMKLYPLLVHLPVFLAFSFISRFKPIKVFFVLLTLVAISTSFSFAGLIISYFFDSSRKVVNIVCYILYLPIGFMIYKYLRPPFLYMLRNTDKGWLGFCIIPLAYSLLIYSIGMYNLDNVIIGSMIKDAVLLFAMVFSAYFLIFRYFQQTRKHLILQNEQNLLQMQVSAAQAHLEELKASQEKTIIYRHDMRHHLSLINSYLADSNKTAAQNYISQVEEAIEDAAIEKYCNNYTVNLILSSYITRAKNEQIAVETQLALSEKNTVSDMDLCVLFANAVDNAINACKNIADAGKRSIKIICKTKEDQLFIQVANRYEGDIRFVGDMPISQQENHGLGTKSIAAIAEKYGGMYSFTAEGGVFKASIIL